MSQLDPPLLSLSLSLSTASRCFSNVCLSKFHAASDRTAKNRSAKKQLRSRPGETGRLVPSSLRTTHSYVLLVVPGYARGCTARSVSVGRGFTTDYNRGESVSAPPFLLISYFSPFRAIFPSPCHESGPFPIAANWWNGFSNGNRSRIRRGDSVTLIHS